MIPPLGDTKKTINQIRMKMKEKKMSQTKLAEETKISRVTVCRFLSGKVGVRHDRFLRILDSVGLVVRSRSSAELTLPQEEEC